MNKFSFCAALLLASHFVSASEKSLGSSPTTVTFLAINKEASSGFKRFILSSDGTPLELLNNQALLGKLIFNSLEEALAASKKTLASQVKQQERNQVLAHRLWTQEAVAEAIIKPSELQKRQEGAIRLLPTFLSRALDGVKPGAILTVNTKLVENEQFGEYLLKRVLVAGAIATVGIAGAIFNVAMVKASLPRVSLGSIAEYTGQKALRFVRV